MHSWPSLRAARGASARRQPRQGACAEKAHDACCLAAQSDEHCHSSGLHAGSRITARLEDQKQRSTRKSGTMSARIESLLDYLCLSTSGKVPGGVAGMQEEAKARVPRANMSFAGKLTSTQRCFVTATAKEGDSRKLQKHGKHQRSERSKQSASATLHVRRCNICKDAHQIRSAICGFVCN